MPGRKTFFLVLFLMTTLLFAQNEKTETEKEKVNSLEKGAWSLQFQIKDNFTLTSFKGQTISAKYHFTEASAIRAGITLNGNYSDYDQKQVDENNNIFSKSVSERDEIGITLNADYLFYLNSKKPINFFFGGGLLFGFTKRNNEDLNDYYRADTLDHNRKSISENATNNYGLNLLAGVEWFVNSYISIHAEYYIQMYYSKNSDESKSIRTDLNVSTNDLITTADSNSERFVIYPNGVKFGLSVYF